jgi:hypothetical protein
VKEQRGISGTLVHCMLVQVVLEGFVWFRCTQGQRNDVLQDSRVEAILLLIYIKTQKIYIRSEVGPQGGGGGVSDVNCRGGARHLSRCLCVASGILRNSTVLPIPRFCPSLVWTKTNTFSIVDRTAE